MVRINFLGDVRWIIQDVISHGGGEERVGLENNLVIKIQNIGLDDIVIGVVSGVALVAEGAEAVGDQAGNLADDLIELVDDIGRIVAARVSGVNNVATGIVFVGGGQGEVGGINNAPLQVTVLRPVGVIKGSVLAPGTAAVVRPDMRGHLTEGIVSKILDDGRD